MTFYQGANGDYVFANGNQVKILQITPANIATGTTDGSLISFANANTLLKIRIISIAVQIGNIATNVTVKSKVGVAASTAISPLYEFGANGGIVLLGEMGQGVLLDAAAGGSVVVTTTGSAAATHITGTYCYC